MKNQSGHVKSPGDSEGLPEACDRCPREFVPGTRFRRVSFVFDAEASVVGPDGRQAPPAVSVEHAVPLVLCAPCAETIETGVLNPLPDESVSPSECLEQSEMSDAELAEAFARQEEILSDGETEPVAPPVESEDGENARLRADGLLRAVEERLEGLGGRKSALNAVGEALSGEWYFLEAVRYCARCNTRRCERQPGGTLPCRPPPEWHVDSPSTQEEWEKAARSVGVKGPGAMQQAKHVADAACRELGLEYEETAPVDVVHAVNALRGAVPRLHWMFDGDESVPYPNRHGVTPHDGGVAIQDEVSFWHPNRRVLSRTEAVELAGWLLACARIAGEDGVLAAVSAQLDALQKRERLA